MKLRLGMMVFLLSVLMPFTQACLITNRDIDTLKEQVRLSQKSITDLQKKAEEHSVRLEGVDNSLQMLEARVDDNTERIEDLRAGLTPEGSPAMEAAPLTPAPAGMEKEAPAAPEASAAQTAKPPIESPPLVPRTFAKAEDLYNSAYGHYEKGEYGQAILEFEEYVANYGASELADNAQYWIGECYYAQKDFRQAIREFDKVEKSFPKGNKIPAAKLKKGLSYHELGSRDEALKELKEVIAKYPEAEEVPLAKEKLKAWK